MKNAYIQIDNSRVRHPQLWVITGVDNAQLEWLRIFASQIEGKFSVEMPECGPVTTKLGPMSYQEFREFLGDAGYRDAITLVDAACR